ncbi:unnamed protein product [Symbiodinium pilosum]|uniref:Uncharacterized protein n=1 Tax=Symbiodinium pilosum TaxID=2952 RepID=A0A812M2P5_SYMPI|nr:unnamed protein product [Symbiodinium pilosum]
MHVPAAAAAAGTAFTGKWLFDYNRANFQYDVPQRFGRFMTSRGMLNAQVGQYRQDVHGIAELTSSKMDTVQAMMTLVLCVCAALSDAGRIGMHGCAPPQWLCGLYSGHIYTSILYCGTALWLGMHGSLRAQCAMTSLLTRKVRLPIPSMAQLDAARSFGSAFEQQKFGDIFRVPFMRHPEDAPELPPADAGDSGEDDDDKKEKGSKDGKKAGKKKASKVHLPDPRTEFSSTARDTVPSWIRDEQVVDKGGGLMGLPARDDFEPYETPDHFKMLLAAQEEWWQYDVYARILMLYGSCQFLYAVCYYCIGTTTAELRGFWISWSMPMLFMAAQVLILRLDVVRTSGNHMLPNAEWIGHLAPYFAVTATTLEYRHLYSPTTVILTWVFVFLTYFAHIVMAMRFLDLAWPDWNRATDMPDEPGKPWWPSSWKVPSAFRNALWLLAPPKKLEPGQHDLLHEAEGLQSSGGGAEIRRRGGGKDKKGAKAAGKAKEVGEGLMSDEAGDTSPKTYHGEAEGAYTGRSPFKAFAEARSPDLPWQLARVAICTVGFLWLYMGVALFVEMNVGPDTLMKPPGEPPWIRDQKMKNIWVPKAWHMSSERLPSDYRLESSTLAKYEDGSIGGFNPDDIHSPGVGQSGVQESPEHGHSGGHSEGESHSAHRRLAGDDQLLRDLLKAKDGLAWLHDSLQEIEAKHQAPLELSPSTSPPFMAPTTVNVKEVKWPALFEPQHLLCRGSELMALTSRGFGAHLLNLDAQEVDVNSFALEGLGAIRSLVGGNWLDDGLQLITKVGELFDCPGAAPVKGRWACKNSTTKLPLPRGSSLLAAAMSKPEETGRIVALLFEKDPSIVNLFHDDAAGWTSVGEVHLPSTAGHVGLSISGKDVLALLDSGAVLRRNILEGSTTWHPPPPATQLPREYRAICNKESEAGGLLRLALRQAAPKLEAWLPELSVD